jgi:hypothetical protein
MKIMKKTKMTLLGAIIVSATILSGCAFNWFDNELGKMMEAFKGRNAVIQTYDEDSNIIDQIDGRSISIKADETFEITDEKGNVVSKSPVIKFTVGGKEMLHVGSSLILAEKGLPNVFEEYAKSNDVMNQDRSVPFLNQMLNKVKNFTVGMNKIILIRSQTGKPLATYVGDSVSHFATDIDKSTGLIVDGHYLFIYRCDYTIYDMDLFKD